MIAVTAEMILNFPALRGKAKFDILFTFSFSLNAVNILYLSKQFNYRHEFQAPLSNTSLSEQLKKRANVIYIGL